MPKRLGRYEVVRPIASGGMGTVYLGRAVGVGGFERRVALKVMHPGYANNPQFVRMFLDEARVAARIHHPNVVATVDVEQGKDGVFLAMEWVDGPALSDLLDGLHERTELLPQGIACRVVLDALSGLHAAHELTEEDGKPLNIVHRDVSPQNILVGSDGIARITDFGVARAASRLAPTTGGVVKGKLCYMAPEQARGEPFDRRIDIYAAGIVLWEALVGRMLFDAENDAQVLSMVCQGNSLSPREANPRVPEPISEVCMNALAYDAGERYATALDFADALEEAMRMGNLHLASPREVSSYLEDVRSRIELTLHTGQHQAIESDSEDRSNPEADTRAERSGPVTGNGTVSPTISRVTKAPTRRTLVAVLGGACLLGAAAAVLVSQLDKKRAEAQEPTAVETVPVAMASQLPPAPAPTGSAIVAKTEPVEPAPIASAQPVASVEPIPSAVVAANGSTGQPFRPWPPVRSATPPVTSAKPPPGKVDDPLIRPPPPVDFDKP